MFCWQVEIQLRFPVVISYDMLHRQMIYGHEGVLNDNRVKSHLSHFWLGIISNTVFLVWVYSLRYCDMIHAAWTETDDGPWLFSIEGRRWTVGRRPTVHLMDEFGRQTMIICPRWTEVDGGRRRTVHLMDGFRRRTIRNLKMWTEVNGWTDGRKSVRGGLLQSEPVICLDLEA